MAWGVENRKGTVSGIIFVAIFASTATYIATLAPVKALGLSPLVNWYSDRYHLREYYTQYNPRWVG